MNGGSMDTEGRMDLNVKVGVQEGEHGYDTVYHTITGSSCVLLLLSFLFL